MSKMYVIRTIGKCDKLANPSSPWGFEDKKRWELNNARCKDKIQNGRMAPEGGTIDVKIIPDNNPVKYSSELSNIEYVEE